MNDELEKKVIFLSGLSFESDCALYKAIKANNKITGIILGLLTGEVLIMYKLIKDNRREIEQLKKVIYEQKGE